MLSTRTFPTRRWVISGGVAITVWVAIGGLRGLRGLKELKHTLNTLKRDAHDGTGTASPAGRPSWNSLRLGTATPMTPGSWSRPIVPWCATTSCGSTTWG
ncbi:MAG TPA: hypothetical protein EYO90_00150 [Candidatus Latescibacteria bacterium]|nr:hypothetical protein [Candidatus Latescibacterota bacterium]